MWLKSFMLSAVEPQFAWTIGDSVQVDNSRVDWQRAVSLRGDVSRYVCVCVCEIET